MADVTLQKLSDCGLNPFAVKLLVESWTRHEVSPKHPVKFDFMGCRITLAPTPVVSDEPDLDAYQAPLDVRCDHKGGTDYWCPECKPSEQS